jgi:hypothetical protein
MFQTDWNLLLTWALNTCNSLRLGSLELAEMENSSGMRMLPFGPTRNNKRRIFLSAKPLSDDDADTKTAT